MNLYKSLENWQTISDEEVVHVKEQIKSICAEHEVEVPNTFKLGVRPRKNTNLDEDPGYDTIVHDNGKTYAQLCFDKQGLIYLGVIHKLGDIDKYENNVQALHNLVVQDKKFTIADNNHLYMDGVDIGELPEGEDYRFIYYEGTSSDKCIDGLLVYEDYGTVLDPMSVDLTNNIFDTEGKGGFSGNGVISFGEQHIEKIHVQDNNVYCYVDPEHFGTTYDAIILEKRFIPGFTELGIYDGGWHCVDLSSYFV